jgi:DNA helicase-2/ATP-dependent DNA helicase PcrA
MTDDEVFELLNSKEELVVIEAPAGCGKTHQGANYASLASESISSGRVLILTHTHAACSVFADRTKENSNKVEIKTIDSLIVSIASAYHSVLGLPPDVATWANENGNAGFSKIAEKVALLLDKKPRITKIIASWYPVVICDEHQDSSAAQNSIILSLYKNGSTVRVFGDPMQIIYSNGDELVESLKRWTQLKALGSSGKLEYPHRWDKGGNHELGQWVLQARSVLSSGCKLDLTKDFPQGLKVLKTENISQTARGYQLDSSQRKDIDRVINDSDQLLVMAAENITIKGLNSSLNRRVLIWEGHTRGPLNKLVRVLSKGENTTINVAKAALDFISMITVGFSPTSHENRFIQEIETNCERKAMKKPLLIQNLARIILSEPNHKGVSSFLVQLKKYIDSNTLGFDKIKIDYKSEFNDAIRLGEHENVLDGVAAIQRKRSFSRPSPPRKCLSTIHKAKGLECNSSMIMACDGRHFPENLKSRNLLYVALSRAKDNLTIVVSEADPCPLLYMG